MKDNNTYNSSTTNSGPVPLYYTLKYKYNTATRDLGYIQLTIHTIMKSWKLIMSSSDQVQVFGHQ